jgi:hypothetical protein
MDTSSNEVPLRDHLEALLKAETKRTDERIEGEAKRTDVRFNAIERALTTSYTTAKESLVESKTAAEKLADKQNEWRGSINDVITTRISREEHEASRKPLSDKLDDAIGADWQDRGPWGVGMSNIVSSSLTILALLAMLVFGVFSQIRWKLK